MLSRLSLVVLFISTISKSEHTPILLGHQFGNIRRYSRTLRFALPSGRRNQDPFSKVLTDAPISQQAQIQF